MYTPQNRGWKHRACSDCWVCPSAFIFIIKKNFAAQKELRLRAKAAHSIALNSWEPTRDLQFGPKLWNPTLDSLRGKMNSCHLSDLRSKGEMLRNIWERKGAIEIQFMECLGLRKPLFVGYSFEVADPGLTNPVWNQRWEAVEDVVAQVWAQWRGKASPSLPPVKYIDAFGLGDQREWIFGVWLFSFGTQQEAAVYTQ